MKKLFLRFGTWFSEWMEYLGIFAPVPKKLPGTNTKNPWDTTPDPEIRPKNDPNYYNV